MEIKVLTLGAGQDVGRSCVVVRVGGKTVMFDCGIHMSYQDERRFPDFKLLSRSGNYSQVLDAVIITHFHLDHCGALPYFTEVCGYDGPIYMTYPTKAIMPVMLEDFHKVMDKKGEGEAFQRRHIHDCMRKVTAVDLHQTVQIAGEDMEIRAYYAGHVLGAAMFYLRVGNESVVYTGDYNMTPDRHLGAASIDRLRPDLLITETTYATTIRESKRVRERDFLTQVHETVERGGKVLIPVFAMGRAQELCILLDEYWERMNLDVPIYFSAGMASKANMYYNLLVNWTSEKIKGSQGRKDPFGFGRISKWDRSLIDKPGPCVLFASPGMLHGGVSLEVFKQWATSELNMVVLPGYCLANTLGSKLIAGGSGKTVDVDKRTKLTVACKVRYLSFSAHADAKGIMGLIQQCAPRNVMLVHGDAAKMEFMSKQITKSFKLRVFMPANGTTISMRTSGAVPVHVSKGLAKTAISKRLALMAQSTTEREADAPLPCPVRNVQVDGFVLTASGRGGLREVALLGSNEIAASLGLPEVQVTLGATVGIELAATQPGEAEGMSHKHLKKRKLLSAKVVSAAAEALEPPSESSVLEAAASALSRCVPFEVGVEMDATESSVRAASVAAILSWQPQEGESNSQGQGSKGHWQFCCSWLQQDEAIASACLEALRALPSLLLEAAAQT